MGSFIVDFCAVEARLVVELDGGQHARKDNRYYDCDRTRVLESRGYRVLRFWNSDVLMRLPAVLARIVHALKARNGVRSP